MTTCDFRTRGFGGVSIQGRRIGLGERLTGWVAANVRPMLNTDAALDLAALAPDASSTLTLCLSVPLVGESLKCLVGVLSLYSGQQFSTDQLETAGLLAAAIATALSSPLENRRGTRRVGARGRSRLRTVVSVGKVANSPRLSPVASCRIGGDGPCPSPSSGEDGRSSVPARTATTGGREPAYSDVSRAEGADRARHQNGASHPCDLIAAIHRLCVCHHARALAQRWLRGTELSYGCAVLCLSTAIIRRSVLLMAQELLSLVRQGRFGEADRWLRALTCEASPDLQVIRAEYSTVGRPLEAARLARRALGREELHPSVKSRYLTVLGNVELEQVGPKDRLLLQSSVVVAKQGKCLEQLCWAQLRLLTSMFEVSPCEASAGILREVRKHVAQLGDPFVSAALHVFVSEVEAKRGAIGTAARHLRVARSLLDRFENTWLNGMTAIADFCVAYLSSDLDRAHAHAERALHSVATAATPELDSRLS